MPSKRKPAPPPAPEHAWERQPNETDSAWAAFVTYRDLGPNERSTSKLTTIYRKLRKNFTVWSAKYDWVSRCHAYDLFVDRELRASALEARKEMNRRHLQLAHSLEGAGALGLNKIIAAEKAGTSLLKPSEVKDFIALGIQTERLALGEPDTIAEQRLGVADGVAGAGAFEIVFRRPREAKAKGKG